MSRPILFHPKLGWAPSGWTWSGDGVSHPGPPAVARKLELEMMAEELRLLYVAMTRAKEKLILSVALTGGARDLEKLAPDAACPVEPQVLAGCQSVGQWVLLPALARPDGEALRRAAGCRCPSRRRTSARPGISALWTGRSSRRSRRRAPFPHPVPRTAR
ncbi:MAG: 3'-5' exonuclease [Flavonifractor plautii]